MDDVFLDILPHPHNPVLISRRIWFVYRAAGDCVCKICKRKYIDHKMELEEVDYAGYPFLHILCCGDRVKL